MGWVYLEHPETGGTTRVPDAAEVLAAHEARGWVRTDPPEEAPFVPLAGDGPASEAEWVELTHPDLPIAVNRVPNNPAALQGAYDSGWRRPEPQDEPQDEPDPKPEKRTTKRASTQQADHNKEG